MKTGTKLIILTICISAVNTAAALALLYWKTPLHEAVVIEVGILILSVLISALLIKYTVSRPINNLIQSMKEYKSGGEYPKTDRSDEIGQLQNSFSELTGELAAEKAKQNRIIASISHDIKTPLTSVMGYTEFLKNPNLSQARREKYTETIYNKALEIKNIVIEFDDYLSFNLDINLNPEFITVDNLLSDTAKEMREDILESGLKIVYSGCACGDAVVYIDKAKIHRVFMNIVTNAVKHSGKPEVNVRFFAYAKGENIEFRVADDGCGCRPEELPRLFEPMYTTDKSRSVAGLGLAICREIVTSHNGEIRAESEYGKSFTVIFTLKRAQVEGG